MLAQEGEQINLAAYFAFALDRVEPQEKVAPRRFDYEAGVDRVVSRVRDLIDSPKVVIFGELIEERFTELGVGGHGLCFALVESMAQV
jgi:hypothetical protein